MADEAAVTQQVTQGNATEARTETGEIKDQQTSQATGSANQETKTEAKNEQASTETKAETKAETKTDAKGPPDKYEFKAPEGYEIDAKVVADAEPIFKELGLTNEQGQKLVDIYAKHSVETANQAQKAYEDFRTDLRNKVVADPAIGDGKEGLRPEVKANIARAIDSVGDAKAVTALKEALDLTGAGDHPAILGAFNALGKLLSEGTAVRAGGVAPVKAPGTGPRNAAQALFPNLPSSANP